jgi:hypothetical protein
VEIQFVSGFYNWRVRLLDAQEIVARTTAHIPGAECGRQVWLQIDPEDFLVPKGP